MTDGATTDGGPATGAQGRYEFSTQDYDLFRGLSNRMRYLALLMGVLAILGIPRILGGSAGAALVTLLYTVTGVLTMGASNSLRRIITTDDTDVSHLLTALGSVNNLLTVVVVLVTTLLAVGAGAIMVAYVLAVFL